jgi:hypothetical protein
MEDLMFYHVTNRYYMAIFLALVTLCSATSFAARVEVPKEPFNLTTAPGRGLKIRNVPTEALIVNGFKRGEVRKHLMLAHGPEFINAKFQTVSSFLGTLGNDYCEVKNSPIKNPQTFEQKADYYKMQSDVLRKCLRYQVTELGPRPIRYQRKQPDCKIEQVHELNPKCGDAEYLSWNKIEPMDYFIFSGLYIAGDASGHSMDLSPLDAARIRLTVEPWGNPFPMSIPYPYATSWPVKLSSDYHMGNIKIFNSNNDNEAPVVDASLLVSNNCEKDCNRGNCASVCDFTTVTGAEMKLYELPKGKDPQFIDLWYAGGIVPAKWEGLLPTSRQLQYNAFVPGRRYRLEADLSYPDMYYRLFKKGFEQLLVDLSSFKAGYSLNGGSRDLPVLTPISAIKPSKMRIPVLKPYTGLGSGGGLASIWTSLDTMNAHFHMVGWPPYYEEFSWDNITRKILDGSNTTKVSVEFTIDSMNRGEEVVLSDITVTRKSNVLRNYRHRQQKLPRVECTPPLQPWE